MMDSGILLVLPVILIMAFILTALKIAGEGERFAVFTLGRYEGLKGPGLIILMWGVQRLERLRVGDVGVLVGEGMARFQEQDLPIRADGSVAVGEAVRIDEFVGSEIRVRPGGAVTKKFRCVKCGHENEIST